MWFRILCNIIQESFYYKLEILNLGTSSYNIGMYKNDRFFKYDLDL